MENGTNDTESFKNDDENSSLDFNEELSGPNSDKSNQKSIIHQFHGSNMTAVLGKGATNIFNERLYGIPKPISSDNEKIKFKVQEITKKFSEHIKKERFIIINSFHHGINESIVHSLGIQFESESFSLFEGDFNRYVNKNKTPDITQYINDFKKSLSPKKQKQKSIIVIRDRFKNQTSSLINALTQWTKKGESDFLDELGSNIYVVYFSFIENPRFIEKTVFNIYAVDKSYEIYVNSYDKISTDLAQLIRSQQQQGKWGKKDKDLLIDLDKIINDPHFTQRVHEKNDEEPFDFVKVLKNKKHIIRRYVLFIACLFPGLSHDRFNKYLDYIISDKTKSRSKKRKISFTDYWDENADEILNDCNLESFLVNNQYTIDFISTADGLRCEKDLFGKFANFVDKTARELFEKVNLFERPLKEKEQDEIFEMTAKMAVSFGSHYGEELFDKWLYKLEIIRKKIYGCDLEIRDLESDYDYIAYLIKKLNEIQFEEDFIMQLKQISPNQLKSTYEDIAIEQQLSKFLFYKGESLPENLSPSLIISDLKKWQKSIFKTVQNKKGERKTLHKKIENSGYSFIKLLSFFYYRDDLKKIVQDFFSKKIETIDNNYFILDILSRLQYEDPSFKSQDFFLQALTHSDSELNVYAFNRFTALISDASLGYYSIIPSIKDWFPDGFTMTSELTKMERYSLALIFWSLNNKFLKDLGNQLDSDPILSSLSDMDATTCNTYESLFKDFEDMQSHFAFVLSNLFQKNTAIAVQKTSFKNADETTAKYIIKEIHKQCGSLVLFWFQLLKKLKSSMDLDSSINEKIQWFIKTIKDGIPKDQSKAVLMSLKELRLAYNQSLADIIQDPKEKEKNKKETNTAN